jgi:hypothetical protein
MNIMNIILLTFALFLISSHAVLAIDLINEDNGGYEVRVTSSDKKTSNISIDGLSTKRDICSSSYCTVEVSGLGSIRVEQGKSIIIENRQLKVENTQ